MLPRKKTSPLFRVLLAWSCIFFGGALAGDSIQRSPVVSSSLASVGYDALEQVLEIEFRNGGIYRYSNVTKEIFTQFMAANSKGRFFALKIRGKFPFARASANVIAGQQ